MEKFINIKIIVSVALLTLHNNNFSMQSYPNSVTLFTIYVTFYHQKELTVHLLFISMTHVWV